MPNCSVIIANVSDFGCVGSFSFKFKSPVRISCALDKTNCSSKVDNSLKNRAGGGVDPGRYIARRMVGPCFDEIEITRASKVVGVCRSSILLALNLLLW